MTPNDEKRRKILNELIRRANETERTAYKAMTPVILAGLQEAGVDAVKLMGLVRALIHYAGSIAHGSIETPADLHIRTADDFYRFIELAWDQVCRESETLVETLKKDGASEKLIAELEKKNRAAPSDPSKRPDIMPSHDPTQTPERPRSLEDIMKMVNTAGSTGN